MVVAQLGARMHYAVARALHQAGLLERFYTDLRADCGRAGGLIRAAAWVPGAPMRRLAGRRPEGVPAHRSTDFPALGFAYAALRSIASTATQRTWLALAAGRAFSRRVVAHGFGGATCVFGYSGECLEMLRAARARGLRTVVEQTIAPRAVEERLLEEERRRLPHWEPGGRADACAEAYGERERAEWECADLILCGSEFVRRGIGEAGGPVDRCVVVPYGVDPPRAGAVPRPAHRDGPLRVLTAGGVGLRKGSHHVLAAARLTGGAARFRMAGPILVPPRAAAELRDGVELVGAVPRTRMAEQYTWADVFLLPSLCEGSATVVYEALAAGLPVVCTPNTGSVVRDGVEGFIVPAGDPRAIADALHRLAADPDLRAAMSARALARAADHTIERYGDRIITALGLAAAVGQEAEG